MLHVYSFQAVDCRKVMSRQSLLIVVQVSMLSQTVAAAAKKVVQKLPLGGCKTHETAPNTVVATEKRKRDTPMDRKSIQAHVKHLCTSYFPDHTD